MSDSGLRLLGDPEPRPWPLAPDRTPRPAALSPAAFAEYSALADAVDADPLTAVPSAVLLEARSLLRNGEFDGPTTRLLERLVGAGDDAAGRHDRAAMLRTRAAMLAGRLSREGQARSSELDERLVEQRAQALVRESKDAAWRAALRPDDGFLGSLEDTSGALRGMNINDARAEARRALAAERAASGAPLAASEDELRTIRTELAELRTDPEVAAHLDALDAAEQQGKVDQEVGA